MTIRVWPLGPNISECLVRGRVLAHFLAAMCSYKRTPLYPGYVQHLTTETRIKRKSDFCSTISVNGAHSLHALFSRACHLSTLSEFKISLISNYNDVVLVKTDHLSQEKRRKRLSIGQFFLGIFASPGLLKATTGKRDPHFCQSRTTRFGKYDRHVTFTEPKLVAKVPNSLLEIQKLKEQGRNS